MAPMISREECSEAARWLDAIAPISRRWDESVARWDAILSPGSVIAGPDRPAAIIAVCHEWRELERLARSEPAPAIGRDAHRAVAACVNSTAALADRWLDCLARDDGPRMLELLNQLRTDIAHIRTLAAELVRAVTELSDRASEAFPVTFQA